MDLKKIVYRVKEFLYKLWYKGHAVVDVPDSRDWLLDEKTLGGHNKWDLLPDEIDNLDKALKLGAEFVPQHGNECTAYSFVYAVKIGATILKNQAVSISEINQWGLQLRTGGSNAHGDTLQNAMKQGLKNPEIKPYVEGYYRVTRNRNVKNPIKTAYTCLARGWQLYTGLVWRGDNWSKLHKTGIYHSNVGQRNNGGHAICFYGGKKNDKRFYAYQAIWDNFGRLIPIGTFKVPFDELKNLMTVYAVKFYEQK